MIEIFTDGASKGNPGPGGFGVILRYGNHKKELSQGYRLTTNNRMELMAVIAGLEAVKNEKYEILIYSDSKYVVDAVNLGWLNKWEKIQFRKIKNPDLWKRLKPLLCQFSTRFIWIRGHSGHPENERCDQLAVAAAIGTSLEIDLEYEKLI